VAIQYSISYDDKGSPSLVKNTIEGSKPVIKSSFNIGEYKPVRTVQTDFDFENITEQNAETVYKSLQKYIYQTDKNSDGGPDQDQQDKFLKQSFEAAAARDIDGKVIDGSTFKEKIKMSAVDAYIDSKLNPIKSTVLSNIPIIGTIYNALKFAGSRYVDPYYDPVHENYYYTGFGSGSVTGEQTVIDRIESAGGVNINNTKKAEDYVYGTDYQGDDKPSDVNANIKSFAEIQNEIGRSLHGGNGNGGNGNQGASPGSQGPGGSDEMGSF
tara:strand:+ start:11 stop:817 length:807 start_codon:yes stop_codon:yes gene_type:complete